MAKAEGKSDDFVKDGNWSKFQTGRKKTGGRKKGTPNKTTAQVAEALQAAYEGVGGDEALTEYAKDDPAGFFKLYTRMLPTNINADLTSNGKTIGQPITAKEAIKMMKEFNKGQSPK